MSERRAARPLVFEGPKGLCACCDRKTEIAIGSTVGQPGNRPWVVPDHVLATVYSGVGSLIREKRTKDNRTRYYLLDPQAFATGRPIRRNKLYFVEGDVGNIAGPFGPEGLKVFFGKVGRDDQRIYVVSTTHRSLSTIRNSPLHQAPEESLEEEVGEDDLF